MKRWAIGLLAATLSTAAMADPAPSFNWSGLYGGISGGWSTVDRNWAYTASGNTVNKNGMESGIWGGHLGLQQQLGDWVFGIEANLGTINRWDGARCTNTIYVCESKISSFWTIGPRVGYVWNNTLWYATGGYTQANIQTHGRNTVIGGIVEQTFARHDGWFFGAGAEYPLTKNLFIGIEYQHLDYDAKLHTEPLGLSNRMVDSTVDLVRARLTWKFGAPFGVD